MVREAEKIENLKKLKLFCKEWLNTWTSNNLEKIVDFYNADIYYQDPCKAKYNFACFLV